MRHFFKSKFPKMNIFTVLLSQRERERDEERKGEGRGRGEKDREREREGGKNRECERGREGQREGGRGRERNCNRLIGRLTQGCIGNKIMGKYVFFENLHYNFFLFQNCIIITGL